MSKERLEGAEGCSGDTLASRDLSEEGWRLWCRFLSICPMPIMGNLPRLFTQLGLPRGCVRPLVGPGGGEHTPSSFGGLFFSSWVKETNVECSGVWRGDVLLDSSPGESVLSLEFLRAKLTGEFRIL